MAWKESSQSQHTLFVKNTFGDHKKLAEKSHSSLSRQRFELLDLPVECKRSWSSGISSHFPMEFITRFCCDVAQSGHYFQRVSVVEVQLSMDDAHDSWGLLRVFRAWVVQLCPSDWDNAWQSWSWNISCHSGRHDIEIVQKLKILLRLENWRFYTFKSWVFGQSRSGWPVCVLRGALNVESNTQSSASTFSVPLGSTSTSRCAMAKRRCLSNAQAKELCLSEKFLWFLECHMFREKEHLHQIW